MRSAIIGMTPMKGASAPLRITDQSICASQRCPVFPTALSIRPVMKDIAHQRADSTRA
jgi:hypothetical protein